MHKFSQNNNNHDNAYLPLYESNQNIEKQLIYSVTFQNNENVFVLLFKK